MTAFAAVVAGTSADASGEGPVASALGAVYGTPTEILRLGGCVLLAAPLRPGTGSIFVEPVSGVAAVGQVLLEDPETLAARYGVPSGVPDLALLAYGYARRGEDVTQGLGGEYACALWDPGARLLLAARDGLGLRPLFLADGGRTLVVSNTLSAAVAHPDVPDATDAAALAGFLEHGRLPAGRTPYTAVRRVPEGHTLRAQRGAAVRLRQHWVFPERAPAPRRRDDDVREGYRDVLARAVRDRVRGAPAAILLSGGIDSTTIAASARAVSPPGTLHAVTAVYDRAARGLELPYARAAAERLRIPLTVVPGDQHEALEALDHGAPTPEPIDEPALADWRALMAAAAAHGDVILYGEDGDALFDRPGWSELRRGASASALAIQVLRHVLRTGRVPYLGIRLRERLGLVRPFRNPRPTWLTPDAPAPEPDAREMAGAAACRPHAVSRAEARLTHGASRYLSVLLSPEVSRQRAEARLPLLDSRVIRYVMETSPIPWCQDKRLPRTAFRGELPVEVLRRPKTLVPDVFEALVASWQKGALDRLPRLQPPLDTWIAHDRWRDSLASADPLVVGVAWRVLELNAWIRSRARASAGEPACTP